MKNVALHNLGCKVNAYEIDVMQQKLQEKGYSIVPFDEQADIYIINTCTVTNIADRKSRQMLHRAKAKNPEAVVVAVGCYVQTGHEDVEKDPAIDLAIGNNKKGEIVEILEHFLQQRQEKERALTAENCSEMPPAPFRGMERIEINDPCGYEDMTLTRTAEHTRAYIKIQDGCNQFCTYCIIPYARGRVRSRRMEEILKEIRGLADTGYQEIVFTGIHISSYGVDFKDGTTLMTLLEKVHEIPGITRIRLGSLEPRIVTEEFAAHLGKMPKICPHFHLSLQSGCDATLKRMNRHYTTSEYSECVKRLRRYFAHPAITTDVIVGFPGETGEEFADTKAFLEQIGFYEMHVFRYSKRRGTVAAGMKEQVPEQAKAARSSELLLLEKQQSRAFRERYINEVEEVLFEEEKEINGIIYQIGHTTRYVKAAKATADSLANQRIKGRITGFLTDEILLME